EGELTFDEAAPEFLSIPPGRRVDEITADSQVMSAPAERDGVFHLILMVDERARARFAFSRDAGAHELSRRIDRLELRNRVAELELEMRLVERPVAERCGVRKLRGISPFAEPAPRARQYVVGNGICRVRVGEATNVNARGQQVIIIDLMIEA